MSPFDPTPARPAPPHQEPLGAPGESAIRTQSAILFDLYAVRDRVVLWFITDDGTRLRLEDPFAPSYFAEITSDEGTRELERCVRSLEGLEWLGLTERMDLWTGRPRPVAEIRVTDLDRANLNLRALERRFPELALFNCDIPPEIHYNYHRGLFTTARCTITHEDGRLLECAVHDDPLSTAFVMPELVTAELKGEGLRLGRRPGLRELSLTADGRTMTWDGGDPRELLGSMSDALRAIDPDLVWTHGGDSALFNILFSLAEEFQVELAIDREPAVRRRLATRGRTYMSYGRVLYMSPDYPLYGRWHFDIDNSFWAHTTGLEGLIEVARMTKIPVQRAARRSIGTGISSIELDHAWREGYLIPWKKTQPERWKSAATLLKSDRGGLVYQPITGVYEDVIELDFVSMYPSIMVRNNISPETIQCDCCPDGPQVPEIGYHICHRRRGLIPRTIDAVIEKRKEYKRLIKKHKADPKNRVEHYKSRQEALKWLLVCCFGYLGYRNARFGRIEAHESTCAFSREKLLTARELCEARGFRVLHAIVDCVWIHKPGATNGEIEELIKEIDAATDLSIALEGRYRWVAFLPSRVSPDVPVPTRYFGCFEDGKLKYRGIEIRRGDQAPYVQGLQERLFGILQHARSLEECRALRAELIEAVGDAEARLLLRDVPIGEVVLERRTSKEAGEYKNNAMTAVAARQAKRAGFDLNPGQSVRYVVLDHRSKDPDSRVRLVALLRDGEAYDAEFYAAQARDAAATILEPLLGETIESLMREWDAKRPMSNVKRPMSKKAGKNGSRAPARDSGVTQPDFLAGMF